MSVKEPSERPSSELSAQNQVEVQKLRTFDDQSLPVDKRLTLLVERLIVDAIQRQDEGLTKVGVSSLASFSHRVWPLSPLVTSRIPHHSFPVYLTPLALLSVSFPVYLTPLALLSVSCKTHANGRVRCVLASPIGAPAGLAHIVFWRHAVMSGSCVGPVLAAKL